jgi:hypothetical protein
MKKYEDLSAEYLMGLRDACYPYTGDDILDAYRAGFLKAREMALELPIVTARSSDFLFDVQFVSVNQLKNLGEKEV